MRVPDLRFPGFNEEWEEKELREISILNPKSVNLPDTFIYIDLESVEAGLLKKKKITNKNRAPSRAKRLLKNNDILYQTVRPYQKNNLLLTVNDSEKYVASTGYAQIRAKEDTRFLYHLLHTNKFVNGVLSRCTGTSYPAVNSKDLEKIKVKIPSKFEQKKIASFLSKIDEKIKKIEKKLYSWESYKKGMIEQLFGQELRFKDKDGNNYTDWANGKIENILKQEIRRVPKPKTGYWRLGLRSHAKGTFHEYIDDPEKIAMDHLYLVKNNDLILNITFAWEHAIALANKEDENKLVSHRFPTYKFFDSVDPMFYKFYVTQSKFKYELENISPGGAGRNRVLSKKDFLKIEIPIPSIPEQTKIANFLSAIDNKTEQLKKELEINKEFKRGILLKMFC